MDQSTPDSNSQVYLLAHILGDKPRSTDVTLSEKVTFQDFNLTRETREGLERCGFLKPSPIQLETIPLGRCGFDLVIQSKAGTGKTCIFAIIALEAFGFNPISAPQTIIIAPTREVAIQTNEVINLIGSNHRALSCALCIGGVDVKHDRAKLGNGSQIVIGTPGRIKQLIELNILKTLHIELFVLDEADKLMDDQFKVQIDEVYKRLPRDKQMIATSATYPDELAQFIQQYMHMPQSVRVGEEITLEAIREFYVTSQAGTSTKKNFKNKLDSLKRILISENNLIKCIVFTNFQARAPIICDNLNGDGEFVQKFGRTNYLCAELAQSNRIEIFNHFKKSCDQKLLISTDISARGIDIRDIDVVINFDLPNDNVTYHHRVGRAGRFGQPGKAFTVVSTDSIDQALFDKNIRSDRIKEYLFE